MKNTALLMLSAVLCCPVVAQEKAVNPDSTVKGCDVCDVLNAPVKISCQLSRAQVDHPSLTLTSGMKVEWAASEGTGVRWTVTFRHSPCGTKVFDPDHPACEIAGVKPGQYAYKVQLQGCKRAGTGRLKVVIASSSK